MIAAQYRSTASNKQISIASKGIGNKTRRACIYTLIPLSVHAVDGPPPKLVPPRPSTAAVIVVPPLTMPSSPMPKLFQKSQMYK